MSCCLNLKVVLITLNHVDILFLDMKWLSWHDALILIESNFQSFLIDCLTRNCQDHATSLFFITYVATA